MKSRQEYSIKMAYSIVYIVDGKCVDPKKKNVKKRVFMTNKKTLNK